MQDLKIALLQADLVWENPSANREHFGNLMNKLSDSADLIILPETFTTGFPVDPRKFAEKTDGPTLHWMQKMAKKQHSVITGSLLMETQNGFQNTLIWMRPDGSFETYTKRHVFRMGGEHESIEPGNVELIVELKGWKIKPLICYDLRFPVWSKNTFSQGVFAYDLLLYVANWPAVRAYPWNQLLIARAIENLAFVVGVNRVGSDPQGVAYDGYSQVIDPRGTILSQAIAKNEMIIELSLSAAEIKQFRQKFNVGLDWDSFNLLRN